MSLPNLVTVFTGTGPGSFPYYLTNQANQDSVITISFSITSQTDFNNCISSINSASQISNNNYYCVNLDMTQLANNTTLTLSDLTIPSIISTLNFITAATTTILLNGKGSSGSTINVYDQDTTIAFNQGSFCLNYLNFQCMQVATIFITIGNISPQQSATLNIENPLVTPAVNLCNTSCEISILSGYIIIIPQNATSTVINGSPGYSTPGYGSPCYWFGSLPSDGYCY